MQAGKLDRPITIQQVTLTQHANGQELETWTTFISCNAEWKPLQSNERFRANGLHQLDAGRFVVRYISGITTNMRILFDSVYYKILGIREITRRQGFEIEVETWR